MPDIRLRIELLDTDPLVWRRVLVPEQINLHRLHVVILATMACTRRLLASRQREA